MERSNNFSLRGLLKPIYAFFSARFKEEFSQDPKYLTQIEDQDIKRAMQDGQTFILRRSVADSDAAILTAGEPIKYGDKVMGTVLVEQITNNILTQKNKIIEKTINITLVVFLLGGIVLFAFASRLSGRIRQLASQTEKSIGPDGRIKDSFKASKVQDELGDLSRWFGGMLKRLKEYNTYQEKMADNLEHEIRTPIAGISASLANLEKKIGTSDIEVQSHVLGIRENVKRIETMMTNIREATILEDALKLDEQTDFDLKDALIVWVRNGYKQTFPENSFVLRFPEEPIPFYGDPIRIRQMLDKLIENAVDFSAVVNPITIELSTENQQARISIINEGPELPLELQEQIFDSMVSIRKKSDKKSHLGLGLYVARQIAEFHGGSIQAKNREDGINGVICSIVLPLSHNRL
jgi:signal transduction histidine kinase